ncbi:alpha/beta hydrolase [Nocardia sputi]|uniref:alpha/beta hydrolase n=1 Tax=Nocardia sputi TaxID=2943705 RepID=UPI0020C0819B|nr:alpha/beta fold hydrolase [Nocardia sputi]
MDYIGYAGFLPDQYRQESLIHPTPTWWSWRGKRVHVARAANRDAGVRALAIHGAGGYSGLLWPLAALAAREDVDVMAVDLPLYGDTVEPDPGSVRYEDWIDLLCEFVRAETKSDDRPLVLFGASMGGMLAYEVAARTGAVAHVIATCLLDPGDPAACRAATRWSFTGTAAPVLLRAMDPLLGRVQVPIRWVVESLVVAVRYRCREVFGISVLVAISPRLRPCSRRGGRSRFCRRDGRRAVRCGGLWLRRRHGRGRRVRR